jgi:hypothetical protein
VRKVFFTALVSAALLVVAPASALARGHSSRGHHRVHHARVHHVRSHLKRFGTDVPSPGPTTPSSSDTAGTVASFSGGVLTIRLNDGSEIHGLVTDATELECTAGMTTMMRSDGGGSGDSGGDQSGDQGEHHGGDQGDDQGAGDDRGDNDDTGGAQSCSSSALTPGAVVQGAELKVSSAGAIWDKVELAQ